LPRGITETSLGTGFGMALCRTSAIDFKLQHQI
jgi:hypothetical protein